MTDLGNLKPQSAKIKIIKSIVATRNPKSSRTKAYVKRRVKTNTGLFQ